VEAGGFGIFDAFENTRQLAIHYSATDRIIETLELKMVK
jgi:hypothetical protein